MSSTEWNQYISGTTWLCPLLKLCPKIKHDEVRVLWALLFFPYTVQSAIILLGCACVMSGGEGQLCGTDYGFPWISCFSASGCYLPLFWHLLHHWGLRAGQSTVKPLSHIKVEEFSFVDASVTLFDINLTLYIFILYYCTIYGVSMTIRLYTLKSAGLFLELSND